jgi:hypothetical protein
VVEIRVMLAYEREAVDSAASKARAIFAGIVEALKSWLEPLATTNRPEQPSVDVVTSSYKKVRNLLRSKPNQSVFDPRDLAIKLGIAPSLVLVALHRLERDEVGALKVAVFDDRGFPVDDVDSFDDLPEFVRDEFGDKHAVGEETAALVFRRIAA